MTNKRFTNTQIKQILRQAEEGTPVTELCLKYGMCRSSYYKWRVKFDVGGVPPTGHIEKLEDENRRLKKMYAEASLKIEALQEALLKRI